MANQELRVGSRWNPAREPRIGALSWGSSAAVFGGWNGRVPK